MISGFSCVAFVTLIAIHGEFHVHRSCLQSFTVSCSGTVPLSQGKEQMCSSAHVCYVVSHLTTCQHLKLVHCHPKNLFSWNKLKMFIQTFQTPEPQEWSSLPKGQKCLQTAPQSIRYCSKALLGFDPVLWGQVPAPVSPSPVNWYSY